MKKPSHDNKVFSVHVTSLYSLVEHLSSSVVLLEAVPIMHIIFDHTDCRLVNKTKKNLIDIYHRARSKHPGIDKLSCKSLQLGITSDSSETVRYASGRGKKLQTPAMVTHFPPTNSTDNTKAAYTTDTDTNPMIRRTTTYWMYERTSRERIASALCATIMAIRMRLRPNLKKGNKFCKLAI